jgi:hypothetical protein
MKRNKKICFRIIWTCFARLLTPWQQQIPFSAGSEELLRVLALPSASMGRSRRNDGSPVPCPAPVFVGAGGRFVARAAAFVMAVARFAVFVSAWWRVSANRCLGPPTQRRLRSGRVSSNVPETPDNQGE